MGSVIETFFYINLVIIITRFLQLTLNPNFGGHFRGSFYGEKGFLPSSI